MSALLLVLALVAAPQPAGTGRYCVTPLWPWPAQAWVRVVVEAEPVARPVGWPAKGDTVWLKFKSAPAALDGSRGACWWLKRAATTTGKPNPMSVEGGAP